MEEEDNIFGELPPLPSADEPSLDFEDTDSEVSFDDVPELPEQEEDDILGVLPVFESEDYYRAMDASTVETSDGQISDELDPRLSAQIEDGLGDAQAYQDDAMKDAQAQIDNYNIRFANAQAYDEKYGTQTALTMPKPQGTELTSTLAETRGQHFRDAVNSVNQILDGDNALRAKLADSMLDMGMGATDINAIINGAEFTPFLGAAMGLMDVPENYRESKAAWERGDWGEAAKLAGINIL